MKKKLIRITTVPISLEKLLENQLRFMKTYYEVIAVSSNQKELQRIKDLQQGAVYAVQMIRQITPLKDLIALFKLILLFLKENPQIIYTHTPKAGTLGMLAGWLCRVPVRMHTVAGLPLLEVTGIKRFLLVGH